MILQLLAVILMILTTPFEQNDIVVAGVGAYGEADAFTRGKLELA